MNPKISVIGQVYPWKGGISHYNSMLCNELAKISDLQVISFTRIFPKFLYPGQSQKDEASPNFFHGRAEFILDMVNPLTWWRTARHIQKFKPQFIFFHWYTPILAIPFWFTLRLAKWWSGAKVVAVIHNVLPHERRFFDRWLTSLVFRLVDIFIAQSEKDQEELRRWAPWASAKAMFHPIYELFQQNISPEAARVELGVNGNVILFFGAIRDYKGLDYLLEAMPEILKKIPTTLVIAGEVFGSIQPLMEKINSLGIKNAVRLHSHYISNQEVAKFFAAADAVVSPYVSGTQSGVITIAYSFNKPVIATDVGGFREMVFSDTGYLVESKNSQALAEAIVKFFVEKDRSRFAKGIENIRRRFSWEVLREKIKIEILANP